MTLLLSVCHDRQDGHMWKEARGLEPANPATCTQSEMTRTKLHFKNLMQTCSEEFSVRWAQNKRSALNVGKIQFEVNSKDLSPTSLELLSIDRQSEPSIAFHWPEQAAWRDTFKNLKRFLRFSIVMFRPLSKVYRARHKSHFRDVSRVGTFARTCCLPNVYFPMDCEATPGIWKVNCNNVRFSAICNQVNRVRSSRFLWKGQDSSSIMDLTWGSHK